MTKPLRDSMPTVAAWIDDLRAAFGADMINAAIRAGIDGQPLFHASEGGVEVGTPIPYDPARAVKGGEIVLWSTDEDDAVKKKEGGRRGR